MRIYNSINDLTFDDLANNSNEYFFRKENISFKRYRGLNCESEIHVKDLKNALKPGKEVKEYIFKGNMWDVLYFTYDVQVSEVLEKLYKQEVRNIEYMSRQHKGIRIFSPFAEIVPIKTPGKWTLSHVWKSILSGQIKSGQTNLYLTDDYAHDAATNFGKGEIDVVAFAKKIIEDPSGWWVAVGKETEELIHLSVSCHTFDYKTLFYSKKYETKQAETLSNMVTFDLEGQATKKQLWALHCITKKDTRNLQITKQQASEWISKSKQGVNIFDLVQ
jgi:hypothetical protein